MRWRALHLASRRATAAGCVVTLLVGWMWACTDFTVTRDPTGGLPDVIVARPSFETDIQPIFTRRCTRGGCHSLASAQAGLVLERSYAYDSLVNRPALLADFVRVKPGDYTNSWLWRMIVADAGPRFGLARMPLLSTPLTPNQVQTIVNWIDEGAPRR